MDFSFLRTDYTKMVNTLTFPIFLVTIERAPFFQWKHSYQYCTVLYYTALHWTVFPLPYLSLFSICFLPYENWSESKKITELSGAGVTTCPTTSCFINFSALSHNNLSAARMKKTQKSCSYTTESKEKHIVPTCRYNTGKRTIGYAACIIWDEIPLNLKELNIYQFSKQLKPYLLSEQHS